VRPKKKKSRIPTEQNPGYEGKETKHPIEAGATSRAGKKKK
jgi:hypothetical protein